MAKELASVRVRCMADVIEELQVSALSRDNHMSRKTDGHSGRVVRVANLHLAAADAVGP